MAREDTESGKPASGADHVSYRPTTPSRYEASAPKTLRESLDAIAEGHAGVVLISGTEPTDPAVGQIWLDTSATGSAGSGVLTVGSTSTDVTLTGSDTVMLCDASGGNIIVTLPAAASNPGRRYLIKKIDSSGNTVTIDGNGTNIDGFPTKVITAQYDIMGPVSDITEWWLV